MCRRVGNKFVLKYSPDTEWYVTRVLTFLLLSPHVHVCGSYKGIHTKWMLAAIVITAFYLVVFPTFLFFRRRHSSMLIMKRRFWQRDTAKLNTKVGILASRTRRL